MPCCCAGPPRTAGDKPSARSNDGSELFAGPSMLLMAHELERTGTLAYQGGFWDDFALTVSNSVSSGATSLSASIPSTQDVYEFFSSLVSNPADNVSVPPKPADSSVSDASMETMECDPKQQGQPNIDWRSMPLKGYVNLPSVLQPFLNLPYLDHYLIIGRPTMAPSCGLAKYREVTPKADRAAAPFLIVIDKPGMLKDWKDDKYIWVEFNLGDVFMLDVSKMKKMADYVATLSKKGKWNFKDRQKKFKNPKLIKAGLVPIPPNDREFVDQLWPLYKQTGEKNGFTVLSEEEFYDFHLTVPNLEVYMVRDVRDPANPKLVSFCTGVRWQDVIMPLWCGTDYENDLNRTCSTYFNMLYAYVEIAIADPGINWVDLGASRRTAKMAIGFQPYPSSGYFRCKNSVMQAMVETMMANYYEPERLINDP